MTQSPASGSALFRGQRSAQLPRHFWPPRPQRAHVPPKRGTVQVAAPGRLLRHGPPRQYAPPAAFARAGRSRGCAPGVPSRPHGARHLLVQRGHEPAPPECATPAWRPFPRLGPAWPLQRVGHVLRDSARSHPQSQRLVRDGAPGRQGQQHRGLAPPLQLRWPAAGDRPPR